MVDPVQPDYVINRYVTQIQLSVSEGEITKQNKWTLRPFLFL